MENPNQKKRTAKKNINRMTKMGRTVVVTIARPLLLLLFTIASVDGAFAQSQRIELGHHRLAVRDATVKIADQTGLLVTMGLETFDPNREVNFSSQSLLLGQVLDQIVAGTGHKYVISDRRILIFKETPKSALPRTSVPERTDYRMGSEFDRQVADFSEQRSARTPQSLEHGVRYDTIRREVPHDGVYSYPDRSIQVLRSRREVVRNGQSYLLDTPPSFAIKTNLLYWSTLTPNIAIEFGLGNRTSLDLTASYNPWNLKGDYVDNKKIVHWIIRPEFRYWLCERFNGHFFGLHAFYWQYNVGGNEIPMMFEKDYRYEGNAFGAGISYGYHLALAKRWGLEFNIGAGVAFMDYTKKDCIKCGQEVGQYKKNYFGPTSAGIKLVFMIN